MNEDWLPESAPAEQPEEEVVVASHMPRMDIETLLHELEDVVDQGYKFPWRLLGRSLMHVEDAFDLLSKIGAALPADVKTAEDVLSRRENILREAHEEKAKIINAAKEHAAVMVSNDEIAEQARQRADEILQQAEIEADGIRSEADSYAREAYRRLEDYTDRILTAIQKTRRLYDERAVTRPQEEEEAQAEGPTEETEPDQQGTPMPGGGE